MHTNKCGDQWLGIQLSGACPKNANDLKQSKKCALSVKVKGPIIAVFSEYLKYCLHISRSKFWPTEIKNTIFDKDIYIYTHTPTYLGSEQNNPINLIKLKETVKQLASFKQREM